MEEVYYCNLNQCIYNGYDGNLFGAQHNTIVKEGIYCVKKSGNEYILLDQLLSNNKKLIIKEYPINKGDYFVSDLVPCKIELDEKIINKINKLREPTENSFCR